MANANAYAIAIYRLLFARRVRVYACTGKGRTTWRYAYSFGCGCTLPVQLNFGVVRGAHHGNEHTNAVEWRDRDIEEHDAEENSEALLEVAAYRNGKGASHLVRLERDDVKRECHDAVANNGEKELPVEDTFGDCDLEAGKLAACVGIEQALGCGEWRHAEEHLHGGQCKGSSHQAVGRDSLDGCQNHAERCKKEANHGEIVVAECSQCDTEDEGNHRDVSIAGVGSCVGDAVDDDSCDWTGRSQNLVEWYRYKRTVAMLATAIVHSEHSDTDSETLLIAILRVKSVEKATRMRFSFVPSLDNLSCPLARSIQHPTKVEPVCNTVSNHGSLT